MMLCSLSTFFRQCILFRSRLCLLNGSNSNRRPFFQRKSSAKTLTRTIFSISFVDLYLVAMHELLPSRTLADSLLTFIDFAVRNVFRLVQCIAVCAVASSIVVLPLFSDKKIAAAPAAAEPMRESVSGGRCRHAHPYAVCALPSSRESKNRYFSSTSKTAIASSSAR